MRRFAGGSTRMTARRSRRDRVRGRAALALAAVVLVAAALVRALSSSGLPPLPAVSASAPAHAGDPFAYRPSHQASFIARATAGNAHVLFMKSPGGAYATAARVTRFRRLIEAATAGKSVDAASLEGIVFLESAGNPNAIAGSDPADAAGLTQIVAQTGQSLLGMRIDLPRSRTLTAEIDRAAASGQSTRVARLERERARIDDRFNPAPALAATVRYLQLAQARYGRADLAVVSYHMGIGNLQDVLDAYDGGRAVPYVQLFFDTSPRHHASAYRLLSGFGDDSWTYYWRVLAAEQIMRLYRGDPGRLRRLASLQTATDSAAYVLHPPDRLGAFADPQQLDVAYAQHLLARLPSNPAALGLAYDADMGALAHRLGVSRALYLGLRGPALDLLIELAARVRALSGAGAPLTVTSTVIDQRYQRRLGIDDPTAAAGWSFTIARRYASEAQALAFQAMLDRLQALDVIAWQRYPDEIEVTVASDAERVIDRGP